MYCSNCGTQINDGDKFRPACGTPVSAAPSVSEKVATNSGYQSEKHQKSTKSGYVTKNIVLRNIYNHILDFE